MNVIKQNTGWINILKIGEGYEVSKLYDFYTDAQKDAENDNRVVETLKITWD